ncbi:hypothetical protein NECID01_1949, partial [Nematocida sp. AWRm77]
CVLVEEDLVGKAGLIVCRKEKAEKVFEALSRALLRHVRTVQDMFGEEEVLGGKIALHLEKVHTQVAEVFIKHFSTASTLSCSMEEVLSTLKTSFVYEGYTFGYCVDIAQSAKKDLLKKKYAFGKKVVTSVFKNIIGEKKKEPADSTVGESVEGNPK